jgi:hypothetical protein
MNYQRIYDDIIRQAQSRPKPECYTEKHHVVPRSLGGSDEPNNLVVLTARQHFLAHYCLWKAQEKGTEARSKMAHAFNVMRGASKYNGQRYINSRLYASHRKEYSEWRSKMMSGENHPFYGKTHSEEARKKMSESKSGENHPFYGKTLSEEAKKKIGKAHKGKAHTEEQILKQSITHIENGLKSGRIKGYCFNKARGRYGAHVRINGEQKFLGRFDTPEEAQAVSLPLIKQNLRNLKARLESITLKKAA